MKSHLNNGFRILIDGLWPRGIPKAKIDLWLKELAPSASLRNWFSHDPKKWDEFRKKYRAELKNKPEVLSKISQIEKKEKMVTLVYAARDEQHNNAVALNELL